jgi:hypothetical protein
LGLFVGVLDIFKRTGGHHGLTGKVAAVYCRSPEVGGGVIADIRVVTIGYHPFLVGRYVNQDPSQRHRWTDAIGWIAFNDISSLIVFDDLESARRAYATEDPTSKSTDA